MKKTLFILLICLINGISSGQNFILNASFELYTDCPAGVNSFDSLLNWINPNIATPDYYNQCSSHPAVGVPSNFMGYQLAHTGQAYVGAYLYPPQEYFQGQLSSPLIANECYYFEMYVNRSNNRKYSINDIGVYFSDTSFSPPSNLILLPFSPQILSGQTYITDTLNWTLISSNYLAQGGENFIIIGNFSITAPILVDSSPPIPPTPTVYFYFDDVLLTPCTSINETKSVALSLYPNPANEVIYLNGNTGKQLEIRIFNSISGIALKKTCIINEAIDISQLAGGIYYYQVEDSHKIIGDGTFLVIE